MKNSISRKLILLDITGIVLILLAVGMFINYLNEEAFEEKMAREVKASSQLLAQTLMRLEDGVDRLVTAIGRNPDITALMKRRSGDPDICKNTENYKRQVNTLQLASQSYLPYGVSLYDLRGDLVSFMECTNGDCIAGYACMANGKREYYWQNRFQNSFAAGPEPKLPLRITPDDFTLGSVVRSVREKGLMIEKTARLTGDEGVKNGQRFGYVRVAQMVDHNLLERLSDEDVKVELVLPSRTVHAFSSEEKAVRTEKLPSLYELVEYPEFDIGEDYITHARSITTRAGERVYFNIGVNLRELKASRAKVNYAVFLFLGIALLIMAPLTIMLIRRLVSNPLRELSEMVRGVRDNEYHLPAELGGRSDELGEVARAIDDLAKTIRKRKEELRELNANLQKNVEQRTREYLSAKEEAEAASRAKSVFLATMSHEIRTPLNAIMGFINLLKEKEQDAEDMKYLETIKRSSDALLGIINDILDFAKIESGKMEIESVAANLHQELNNIGSMFFIKAHELGIYFHFYVDPNLPRIITIDLLRYRQILINLLGNALKFTERGHGVYVSVTYDYATESVTTSVRDEGIGIDPAQQEMIFTSFSQAESSTARRFGGTGLGLTICKRLVELMGGELKLKSRPGEGSEFSFTVNAPVRKGRQPFLLKNLLSVNSIDVYLSCSSDDVSYETMMREYLESFGIIRTHPFVAGPMAPSGLFLVNSKKLDDPAVEKVIQSGYRTMIVKCTPMENLRWNDAANCVIIDPPFTPSNLFDGIARLFYRERLEKVSEHPVSAAERPSFRGHVLVAEDNEDNRYLIRVMLERLGVDYTFAHNGQEAVDIWREGSFDMILMDENMPIKSGREAAVMIRKLEHGSSVHTPIVALTANAIKGDREKFLEAGMDDYLSKPIDQYELLRVLKRFLAAGNSLENLPAVSKNREDAPVVQNSGVLIDIAEKAKELEFDPEDILELLGIFEKNRMENLERLREAIEAGDYSAIFETSHKIKSSASALVIRPIIETAGRIETAARQHEPLDYDQWFERLRKEVMGVAAKKERL